MIPLSGQIFTGAAVQQDYAWFCVLLAWTLFGALLSLRWAELRAHPGIRMWLSLTFAGGIVLAAAELAMHASPLPSVHDARLGWDRWMSAALVVQTAALVSMLHRDGGLRRIQLTTLLLGLAGTWFLRPIAPIGANAGLAFAALGLGVAVFLRLRRRTLGSLRPAFLGAAALTLGAAQLASTTGLLSELTTQQRRWAEISLLGLPSAFFQFSCAATLGLGLDPFRWPVLCSDIGDAAQSVRRELRLALALLGVWLLLGFGIAWWTGSAARRVFEDGLVARARSAAALIDPAHVLPVVAPEFHLERSPAMFQENGRRNPVARAPYLLHVYQPLGDDLARVEAINPGIQWAHFQTFRDDHIVSCVFSSQLKLRRDSVAVHRKVSPRDQLNWNEHRAYFEGPVIGPWGEQVRALAPIVHPSKGMLGWVALDYGAGDWAAAQALARSQSFALTGAGAAIVILILLQRLRSRQHALVREQAALAESAARAKTAFLAKVSHELRTPVQSILGYSELLAGLSLPDVPSRWLGSIRQQGQLLIRLVNDLLDLSAMQAGAFRLTPRPTNLAQLVRSCTDSLRPRATAKGLELQCETDPELPSWLELDPDRVRQLVFNLLGNAIKFSNEGGVVVRVRRLPPPEDSPETNVRVQLSVCDTGPGIPPEQQASLFRPFSRLQAHANSEGAGLGLALTAALCQSMRGSVTVFSDGIKGSEFIAELLLAPALPPRPSPMPLGGALALAGKRVLIADDNTLVRELYLACLRSAGAWCETAADGLEAVERCVNEPFDAVVLDVSMPWLDGVESARRIRQHGRSGLRIVGVSAHAGTAEREVGLAAGMDTFLVKPVGLAELVAAIAGQDELPAGAYGNHLADLALLRRLRGQFVTEVPRLLAEIRQATQTGDRPWLAARAHHLKNSADVAGYAEVSLLCSQLQQLTGQEGTRPDLMRVVEEISVLLHDILEQSFSPGEPGDPQKP